MAQADPKMRRRATSPSAVAIDNRYGRLQGGNAFMRLPELEFEFGCPVSQRLGLGTCQVDLFLARLQRVKLLVLGLAQLLNDRLQPGDLGRPVRQLLRVSGLQD